MTNSVQQAFLQIFALCDGEPLSWGIAEKVYNEVFGTSWTHGDFRDKLGALSIIGWGYVIRHGSHRRDDGYFEFVITDKGKRELVNGVN